MKKKVSAVPRGYRTATPCITVNGIQPAVDFHQKAFDATVFTRSYDPTETVLVHAVIKIGNSMISLNLQTPEMGIFSPVSLGNNGSQIHLYVTNVDDLWVHAITAGAREIVAPANVYWGDRIGTLMDPFGHRWSMATRLEHVSKDEMHRCAACLYGLPAEPEDTQGLAA